MAGNSLDSAASFANVRATVGDFTDSAAWSAETEVSASEVVEKQKVVKDILAMQEGLKGLIARSATVQQDCVKAASENEMLQQYINSVTKSLAAKS